MLESSADCEFMETLFHPTRHEQALWRAVITQALMDASSQSAKMEARYEKS